MILLVSSLILFIVSASIAIFANSFFSIWQLSGNSINSFQSLFGTFSVAFLASAYISYWNFKNIAQEEDKSRGSLSVKVDSENIFTIKNQGQFPMTIKKVSSITNVYNRSFAVQKRLKSEFEKNKETVGEDIAHKDINLSLKESVVLALEQTGLDKGIEEYEFIMQIVKIEYSSRSNKNYIKYVGVCRLTSPTSWFIYEISHINDVNMTVAINKIGSQGKFYIDNLYAEFLYKEACSDSPDKNIFPNKKSINTTKTAYSKYQKLINIKTEVPQNKWIIFRIEEKEAV